MSEAGGARERLWEILGASDDPAERPLPEWRRRLHRFCENWIFALVIAFCIRHFALELFRIPSASMEPLLLGDPGLFKGDFVVVDKLSPRWRDFQRWDVAVFQYPVPEVESGKGARARPARAASGEQLAHPLWNPVLGGNFVKRIVALPGERFYIRGGDVFIAQGEQWVIPPKPADLQERLWQAIYRAGDQPAYQPWRSSEGLAWSLSGAQLTLRGEGRLHFTQPLRNVYVKDGSVAVRRLGSSDSYTRIDGIGLTRPQFAYGGEIGSLWDLERWDLRRVTSADMDDPNRGTRLNDLMREWTGDLRVGARLQQLRGELRVVLLAQAPNAAAPQRTLRLTLRPDGWRLEIESGERRWANAGQEALLGRWIEVAQVDAQAIVRIDGQERHRGELPWCDPNLHRPALALECAGEAELGELTIARDIHYTAKGFLVPAAEAGDPEAVRAQLATRLPDAEDRDQAYAALVGLPRRVRGQLLGLPPEALTRAQATRAYGSGPQDPVQVPAGCYFVLGDNSPLSLDSREWGFVPAENLRGRGFLIIFPPARWGTIR
ncbi:MAG: signal peptidase I [Planctomycetota bacterium]|nr:signal peptidase I [Planctomycetota bacterium]MCX8040218.1 signal peptidase I [Planctomycetota bacterium]MDW8372487.1 signal peptidase I [Planctomycetota bacterium]